MNMDNVKYMKQGALQGHTVKNLAKIYKVSENDVLHHTENERKQYVKSRDNMIGIKYQNGDCRECMAIEYHITARQIENIGQLYTDMYIEELFDLCPMDHEKLRLEKLYYIDKLSVKEIIEITCVENVTEQLDIPTINNKEFDRRLKIVYDRLDGQGRTHEDIKKELNVSDEDIERVLNTDGSK